MSPLETGAGKAGASLRAWASVRQTMGGWICLLLLPLVVSGSVVNIDFNGDRNTPGPNARPVTYQGTGAAGGGVYWNGLAADSRLPNGNDNDNLTVGGTNLLDASGARTALSFRWRSLQGRVVVRVHRHRPGDLRPHPRHSAEIHDHGRTQEGGSLSLELAKACGQRIGQ